MEPCINRNHVLLKIQFSQYQVVRYICIFDLCNLNTVYSGQKHVDTKGVWLRQVLLLLINGEIHGFKQ